MFSMLVFINHRQSGCARAKSIFALLLIGCTSLNGCAKDMSFIPPTENEFVTVKVKADSMLSVDPMRVMYRSGICKHVTHNGDGVPFEMEGFHAIDRQLQYDNKSELYEIRLPVNGGGQCGWRLSNVTFGVTLGKPEFFGTNASAGGGGGVVVVFDHNNSQRGSRGIKVSGDLILRKDYYPWVDEDHIGGYRKTIKLIGESRPYLEYYAPQARLVYLEPIVHYKYVLNSIGPKAKVPGNYTTHTYPDGGIYSDGKWHPNFKRLEAIRLAAEARK
jgi:hypothetical protein